MMRLPAPALVFGLILAGCSPGSNEPISAEPEFSRTAYPPQPRSTGLAAMRPSIAARPDDGDLVRYDKVRRIERGGVYTSYPVSLSEAHAYRSLAGGELVVTAPDGRSTRLRVARHEEYPDGNWTLLARGDDGSDAILTFGQDAVFGAINREDGTVLRFLTQGRQVYLVSADRERLAGLENPGAGKRSDMLIPPARPPHAASAASAAGLATPEQPQSVINTAGANDIDVLMGYSNGLVSRIGSESGAVTRMQNLVAFANEAYANSGITMRLRLVRSMLVNYPDNTTNQDALQKMTGSTGTGSTPVDPAFNALRAAREETGADVVAFVRQFREPENDGCGIAWLLGGSQSAITQNDAAFAYSVSSDGSDLRESDGKTYFCRDETLAHEAGHNMGQAHNQEDSTSGGAHTYSYGYREPSAAGFYTVMAYRVTDSSQFPIRYFANPSIAYQGRATGVANQSDNARSMNLTMPIIANFRAAIVPSANRVTSDVDADRRSDFVWYNSTTRRIAYWVMNANAIVRHGEQLTGGGYNVLTTGDFNGDGRVDLVWVGTAGDMQMWQGNGTTFDWRPFVQYPGGWTLVASADADADGRTDLVWYNSTSRRIAYWVMNGNAIVRHGEQLTGGGYNVLTTGDFNGDGRVDLVWVGTAGDMQMWQGNGTTFDWRPFVQYPGGWTLVANADVDADGRTDLIWHNPVSRRIAYWVMNGNAIVRHGEQSTGGGYNVLTNGDFNGDGRVDLVWVGTAGDMQMWQGNGNTFDWRPFVQYPGGWTLIR